VLPLPAGVGCVAPSAPTAAAGNRINPPPSSCTPPAEKAVRLAYAAIPNPSRRSFCDLSDAGDDCDGWCCAVCTCLLVANQGGGAGDGRGLSAGRLTSIVVVVLVGTAPAAAAAWYTLARGRRRRGGAAAVKSQRRALAVTCHQRRRRVSGCRRRGSRDAARRERGGCLQLQCIVFPAALFPSIFL